MVVFGTQSLSLDSGPRVESGVRESDGEGVWSFACSSPVVAVCCPGVITDITPFPFPSVPAGMNSSVTLDVEEGFLVLLKWYPTVEGRKAANLASMGSGCQIWSLVLCIRDLTKPMEQNLSHPTSRPHLS